MPIAFFGFLNEEKNRQCIKDLFTPLYVFRILWTNQLIKKITDRLIMKIIVCTDGREDVILHNKKKFNSSCKINSKGNEDSSFRGEH